MSTVSVLEALKSFLQEKISPIIKLQKPSDNNIHDYKLVNPAIHIGWIPPKGYLPEGMEAAIPCLIVGLDDATDDGQGLELNIRISAAVYSPGLHKPVATGLDYTPDFKGYNDLLNLIDRTVAELMKNQIIDGKVAIQMPVKWGMYQEQPYPYWYGWITFPVKKQTYPTAEIARQFL
ncbi:hypothetical protein D2962_06145 [Biomaibacter acetigenes]|uniref:Uncharacterized protein n=1 Tax=Biomaibacter acetigenes TaxID=2316383 RepID=A0A3G2R4D0_9FIRM|nr:hypothetical protein [Biomaibacter acetigenes]AYO30252.1 hypothetical protein D2962_06145 [Biomaibacter acetigenes]